MQSPNFTMGIAAHAPKLDHLGSCPLLHSPLRRNLSAGVEFSGRSCAGINEVNFKGMAESVSTDHKQLTFDSAFCQVQVLDEKIIEVVSASPGEANLVSSLGEVSPAVNFLPGRNDPSAETTRPHCFIQPCHELLIISGRTISHVQINDVFLSCLVHRDFCLPDNSRNGFHAIYRSVG